MSPVRSLTRSVRKSLPAFGRTQPSIVMPLVRSSEFESGTLTYALLPLNESAPPYLPAADQVAFVSVPVLPVPDWSTAVVPLPASSPQAPTSPGSGPLGTTAVTSLEGALVFPLVSSAVTL